jgi:hypothetical protein
MNEIEGYNFLQVPHPTSGTTGIGPNLWRQCQGHTPVGPHFLEREILTEAQQAINKGLERRDAEFYVRGQINAILEDAARAQGFIVQDKSARFKKVWSEWNDYIDVIFCERKKLLTFLEHPNVHICDLAITRMREFPDLCAGDKFNRYTALTKGKIV